VRETPPSYKKPAEIAARELAQDESSRLRNREKLIEFYKMAPFSEKDRETVIRKLSEQDDYETLKELKLAGMILTRQEIKLAVANGGEKIRAHMGTLGETIALERAREENPRLSKQHKLVEHYRKYGFTPEDRKQVIIELSKKDDLKTLKKLFKAGMEKLTEDEIPRIRDFGGEKVRDFIDRLPDDDTKKRFHRKPYSK
jgi:hypothetical protein